MFGGSAESWTGSEEKQPKLADTTLLQFSKCIHITLSHPSHCCKSSSQTTTTKQQPNTDTKLITMHWYMQKLGACRYYNNSWEPESPRQLCILSSEDAIV